MKTFASILALTALAALSTSQGYKVSDALGATPRAFERPPNPTGLGDDDLRPVAPVPWPASAAALGVGVAGLLRRRSRRRD